MVFFEIDGDWQLRILQRPLTPCHDVASWKRSCQQSVLDRILGKEIAERWCDNQRNPCPYNRKRRLSRDGAAAKVAATRAKFWLLAKEAE
jgi:hypothetical protein